MRIAILGGGASGLISAFLLDACHEITLFEAAPTLGGNIRTPGRNLPALAGCSYTLDAGVIEFEERLFPLVTRLFRTLEVPTAPVPVTTTLFLRDGRRLYAPYALRHSDLHGVDRVRTFVRMLPLAAVRSRFCRQRPPPLDHLARTAFGELLAEDDWGIWLTLLATYAWSTPPDEVPEIGAALALPVLRDFVSARSWYRVVGGVARYVEAIVERLRGEVLTATPVRSVRREPDFVEVSFEGGAPRRFDAVIFATTPDRVLELLSDPSEAERRRFGAWTGADIQTLVHEDRGPYERRGAGFATEFDLFQLEGGRGGYNALLNRLAGIPDSEPRRFGLAFGLEEEIDPARVLHAQPHHVPRYTVDALRFREQVRARNGERRTWYVGAWLGDGLHEGAARSAQAVAHRLGGLSIP